MARALLGLQRMTTFFPLRCLVTAGFSLLAAGCSAEATGSSTAGVGGAGTSTGADAGQTTSAGTAGQAGGQGPGATSTGADGTGGAGGASGTGGAGGSSTVLPLGTVSGVTDVDCGQGGGVCKSLVVHCDGIDDLTATLKILDPGDATRTVTVLGPGGGTAFYDKSGLSGQYTSRHFRVVEVKWADAWEYSATNTSIKAAACRPATVFRWVFDNLHQGGAQAPYCLHGSSGGSGAVGYALAHYGLKDTVDHSLLSFGPVFSGIQYGCDPTLYQGPPRDVCSALHDASFTYNQNNNVPSINQWAGTTTCGSASPAPADLHKWQSEDIDSPGADFSYPLTGTSYYYCVPANAGAGLGSFFTEKAHAASSSTSCFTDCQDEDLNQADVQQMVEDMDGDCQTRH